MKKLLATILVLALLAGCSSTTAFGPCVGAFDDKDPKLVYKLSGRNLFLAIIGSWLMFIPTVVVAVDSTFCPVARKEVK